MNGKGSTYRPVDQDTFANNWDHVFKKGKVETHRKECGCEIDSDEDGEYVFLCSACAEKEMAKE